MLVRLMSQRSKLLKKLYFAYNQLDPDSATAIKLDTEIEYLEHKAKGIVVCSWHPSEGCEECRTTLATNPEDHKPMLEHYWVTKYDENTGKPYCRCKNCLKNENVEEVENENNCSK